MLPFKKWVYTFCLLSIKINNRFVIHGLLQSFLFLREIGERGASLSIIRLKVSVK